MALLMLIAQAVDHFILRIGKPDNPIVFPKLGNYSTELLVASEDKQLHLSHRAPGADLFRYTLNFGTTYSDWLPYGNGDNTPLPPKVWSGTKEQSWDGEHVIVQYWSRIAGSSSHVQHGDANHSKARRFPNMWLQGTFNQFGFDAGFANRMKMGLDSIWRYNFMTEWPARTALNAWGMNPDGQPDKTRLYGDIDGDFVLDRIPPLSLVTNVLNVSKTPPSPYLAWQIALNDATMRYELIPVGSRWVQLTLYILLWTIPIISSILAIFLFKGSFYSVKFNQIGITEKKSYVPLGLRRKTQRESGQSLWTMPRRTPAAMSGITLAGSATPQQQWPESPGTQTPCGAHTPGAEMLGVLSAAATTAKRRTVLLATMEYDIEDWAIKIKIGGLGVMANLMSKNLGHQDLIWVVPCVGGVDYPMDCPGESIPITVLNNLYEVKIQYHTLRNITYVLLDAPIFRQQTTQDPYPPRMDDLDSACYYSAWNQCIAEMMRRFPINLYHINDYHGTVAPLYLLPTIVPCVLSLHNAEFQGLWPMRDRVESSEVCQVFNLDPAVVSKYVQFGEVFNLLHAGASYLRVHQKGFGAVGVSNKYGKRAFARYPILWGMKDVGALPNPDPTDTAPWNKEQVKTADIHINKEMEAAKPGLKLQAQQWANLGEDADAELFVFVGRWSQQKGVDSIADVFPSILEQNPHVQLICIGPVIDLYGKFAAMKLARMMEVYPGRVFSKPEFTALPPYIFSGADFALMPSRDEPFGLVAVEFGRKGALCVGARVGGLGHMPGWWFTVESTTTKHFIHQFKIAIQGALASKPEVRAIMRARAAKQRFPVAQWIEDLEILQSKAIDISDRQRMKENKQSTMSVVSARTTPTQTRKNTPIGSRNTTPIGSRNVSRASSPVRVPVKDDALPNGGLGSRHGPGSVRKRLRKNTISEPASALISEAEDTEDEEERGRSRRSSKHYPNSRPPSPPFPLRAVLDQPGANTSWPLTAPSNLHFASEPTAIPNAGEGASGRSTPLNLRNNVSMVNLSDIKGDKTDYKLQNVSPFFTDSKKEFAELFQEKLEKLNGKNSEDALCIEEYLVKSEKLWFGKLRAAELGKSPMASRRTSPVASKRVTPIDSRKNSPTPDLIRSNRNSDRSSVEEEKPTGNPLGEEPLDEFLLGTNYKPPTGLKHILRLKIGDWPIYSILLAFVRTPILYPPSPFLWQTYH